MSAPKWMPAAGVAGALTVAGSAIVAVAATGPTSEAGSARSSVSSSPSASPEPSVRTPDVTGTPEAVPGDVGAQISAAEAVDVAAGSISGEGASPSVREIDLEFEDGRWIWHVEFAGDDEVEVDAMTGVVVKLERRDDKDDWGDRDDNSGPGSGDDGDDDGGDDDGPNHD